MQTWLASYTLLIGGILFMIGGGLNSMAIVHPWLLPGAPSAAYPFYSRASLAMLFGMLHETLRAAQMPCTYTIGVAFGCILRNVL